MLTILSREILWVDGRRPQHFRVQFKVVMPLVLILLVIVVRILISFQESFLLKISALQYLSKQLHCSSPAGAVNLIIQVVSETLQVRPGKRHDAFIVLAPGQRPVAISLADQQVGSQLGSKPFPLRGEVLQALP